MSYALDKVTLDNLKQICENGNYDLIIMLIELYINSTPAELAAIESHFKNYDHASLGQKAHSLKSSSGNLGINIMQKSCANIEKEAHQNIIPDRELLEQEIESMKSVFPIIQKELSDYLNSLKSSLPKH